MPSWPTGDQDDITAEVDPFQTTLADTGWLLFSRRVWLQGRRYVQGFAVDLHALLTAHLKTAMSNSVLPSGASALIFFQESLIEDQSAASSSLAKPVLLYSSALPHPFDELRIAIATDRLPHGPGYATAQALGIYLVLFLVGGLWVIYRLAATQLDLSQKKADFVSAVSHELKTPLSTIRMYGELLVEGWVKDEGKVHAYHRYIHEESERLSRLIQNVLQLAELERQEWRVQLVSEDPVSLVGEIVDGLESRLERSGFRCSVRSESPVFPVAVDRDALTQILINLIDNAVKFSRDAERKEIVVTISQVADDCVIRVRDFGPGIPRRQLKKIFQKFYRLDSEMTRTTAGTGIGLALVQMLASAMKASVDVANRQPGVEFILRFHNRR